MNGREILRIFGFEPEEAPVSIYPYSPVYRVKYGDQDVVVKRTQRRAGNVMSYTNMLRGHGINIVTPVKMHTDNPQKYDTQLFTCFQYL